jgi:hypothetical protein
MYIFFTIIKMYWYVTLKLIYLERHFSLIKDRERESEIPGERKRVYIITELLKKNNNKKNN